MSVTTPEQQHPNKKPWVVVSGASGGIGANLTTHLLNAGYRVIGSARTLQGLEELQQEDFYPLVLDLAAADGVQTAAAQILTLCDGDLFCLINNAAYAQPGAVEDLSRIELEQQFAVNVFGTHQLTTLLLPALHRGKGGRLINISSILGVVAFPWQGAYNASKFALEGLTDTLRLELEGSSVQVSTIEPGPIRSKFRRRALDEFKRGIDAQQSRHAASYARVSAYYAATEHPTPFTAAPDAVWKRVEHALHSRRPKPRYLVTFPAYALTFLRRILPTRGMDYILRKLGSMR
ncbi:MAG: SDR family NAD(P)-dependent oxidoreductase [Desulfuromonadaceae bacterium]|nr:SDR family NAD(P)-dependent oxidoreductase [Desulfuromonadaceae bacterium]